MRFSVLIPGFHWAVHGASPLRSAAVESFTNTSVRFFQFPGGCRAAPPASGCAQVCSAADVELYSLLEPLRQHPPSTLSASDTGSHSSFFSLPVTAGVFRRLQCPALCSAGPSLRLFPFRCLFIHLHTPQKAAEVSTTVGLHNATSTANTSKKFHRVPPGLHLLAQSLVLETRAMARFCRSRVRLALFGLSSSLAVSP